MLYVAANLMVLDVQASEAVIEKVAGDLGSEVGAFAADDFRAISGFHVGYDLARTSAPLLGDYSYAAVGTSEDGEYDIAILTVWTGSRVFSLIGMGTQGDVLGSLTEIASKTLGEVPAGRAEVTDPEYRLDGVWGDLPRLEHLPAGFVFDQEWSMLGSATPVATSVT